MGVLDQIVIIFDNLKLNKLVLTIGHRIISSPQLEVVIHHNYFPQNWPPLFLFARWWVHSWQERGGRSIKMQWSTVTLDQPQSDFLTAPPPLVQYQNEKGLTSQQEALLDEEFHGTKWPTMINYDQLWSTMIKYDQLWSSLINYDQLWSTLHKYDQLAIQPTAISHSQTQLVSIGKGCSCDDVMMVKSDEVNSRMMA